MKLKFIKFANSVKVNNKQSTSAKTEDTDIEILGGGVVQLKDRHSNYMICTSLYNTIEFMPLDDDSTKAKESTKAPSKKR